MRQGQYITNTPTAPQTQFRRRHSSSSSTPDACTSTTTQTSTKNTTTTATTNVPRRPLTGRSTIARRPATLSPPSQACSRRHSSSHSSTQMRPTSSSGDLPTLATSRSADFTANSSTTSCSGSSFPYHPAAISSRIVKKLHTTPRFMSSTTSSVSSASSSMNGIREVTTLMTGSTDRGGGLEGQKDSITAMHKYLVTHEGDPRVPARFVEDAARHAYKRYGVGEKVLVLACKGCQQGGGSGSSGKGGQGDEGKQRSISFSEEGDGEAQQPPAQWVTRRLVNKHGFPRGDGDTAAELSGPFLYVLATVLSVHFNEDKQYYTVRRADSGLEERADTEYMVDITDPRGIKAAEGAATARVNNDSTKLRSSNHNISKCSACAQTAAHWAWYLYQVCYITLKKQAYKFLNGLNPYGCKFRLTFVNLLVGCSLWFVFCDQMVIAFLPPYMDFQMGVISVIVWVILVLELILEVFIRPEGYQGLIRSQDAYSPYTVRYIDRFHVTCEVIALVLFIPEVMTLLGSHMENLPLGQTTLIVSTIAARFAVRGPSRSQVFRGRLFYALLRLRFGGLVRHWKNWVNYTLFLRGVRVTPAPQQNFTLGSKLLKPFRGGNLELEAPRKGTIGLHSTTKKGEGSSLRQSGVVGNHRSLRRQSDMGGWVSDTHRDLLNMRRQVTMEERLFNAANIGTALMVVNSHRALILVCIIVGAVPLLSIIQYGGGTNPMAYNMVSILQNTNKFMNTSQEAACDYLQDTTANWLLAMESNHIKCDFEISYVIRLQLLPVRCPFQGPDGVVTATICQNPNVTKVMEEFKDPIRLPLVEFNRLCVLWNATAGLDNAGRLAKVGGTREGSVDHVTVKDYGILDGEEVEFVVDVFINEQHSVNLTNYASFLLQLVILIFILIGLSVLRADTGRLVLHPLRRMLKIVSLYSKNPLAPPPKSRSSDPSNQNPDTDSPQETLQQNSNTMSEGDQLGNYETEQLINAITKITDLLRKCWGVAGAGIISHNLARQKDGTAVLFNPCVPGKIVYGIYSFAAISNFHQHQKALKGDIMILINDVAAVLHGEVYRWGLGNSGQCNKNLGSAFLIVYKIGDAKKIQQKLAVVTDHIFASKGKGKISPLSRKEVKESEIKKRATAFSKGSLLDSIKEESSHSITKQSLPPNRSAVRKTSLSQNQSDTFNSQALKLSSLPGINDFADRALLGMLKAFAGIYRDNKIREWKNDMRLGYGIGAFSVELIIGLHAGWAVEGAVGSEYKIDATYLSPHVNMSSRMMSACKQYGVSVLLSEGLEQLLSEQARRKVRHLDTVKVKGSSVKQKIFTYDARHEGVNFFLFHKSEEQANAEADGYSPSIWDQDQDLISMRQHISEDFETEFNAGRRDYLAGDWPSALEHLKQANAIMIESIMDQGYMEHEINRLSEEVDLIQERILAGEELAEDEMRMRDEMGDGPCQCLIQYMENRGGVAPDDWEGFRPLTSK